MDPLSITASVIAVLQLGGASAAVLSKLLSLRDAPQQLQQLWNETEALRALLLETDYILHRRSEFDDCAHIKASLTPVLQTVKGHVLEFEQLIQYRLVRNGALNAEGIPKVNRSYWLRASPDIQRIKQNIRDSREILQNRLNLLGLEDSGSMRSNVLQIQQVAITSQEHFYELGDYQQKLHHEVQQMRSEQRQDVAALQTSFTALSQPLLENLQQMILSSSQGCHVRQSLSSNPRAAIYNSEKIQDNSTIRISATIASQQCPRGCRCRCHTRYSVRTPTWLRATFGQVFWTYSSSISMTSCNHPPCRKSLSKQHFTYYFPTWFVSRAIVASADMDDLFGAGAKILVNIPLIIPEENHMIWSFVIAGNLEQLRLLVSADRNLVHVRNQWGQSILHVAAKIHQPAVFNFLLSLGMDAYSPDENLMTAATTVFTRRGSEDYALQVDADDLAERLGWTPLHKAAALTREGQPLSEALLKSEYADINSRDALGRSPLHWLAENGQTDAIQLLTQDPWRANVHLRDICGFTPLHCAAWADSLDSAAVLLDAGSNANAQDKHMRTPMLHFDSYEMLDLMIDKGADVYIRDDEGTNIMHHVAIADQASLAKDLLERYGHTLCIPNDNGDTPLGLAVQNNSLNVLDVILSFLPEFPVEKVNGSNRSRRNVLHLVALHASTEVMDMLSAANILGIDTAEKDKDGHSPKQCFLECRNAHCAVVRKPFAAENRYWARLLASVGEQAEIPFKFDEEHEEVEVILENVADVDEDSISISEHSIESDSEDEFVDAEDGTAREDLTSKQECVQILQGVDGIKECIRVEHW